MFQVPPEPSARVGNPMGPSAAETAEFNNRRRRQAVSPNLMPRDYQPETSPWARPTSPFTNAGSPQYQGREVRLDDTNVPAPPVSVDMWGNSQQRRSPSPMTYEDPAGSVPANQGAPSVDIWGNRQPRRSPSVMTYDEPNNGPNQGIYDLVDQIDALRNRSLTDNPMAPNSPLRRTDPGVAAMQQGIDQGTRQQNIMFEPGATSSGGATSNFRKIQPEDLNGTTAGTVNGYNGNIGYANDPNRPSPDDNLRSARNSAEFQSGNRVRPGNDAFGDRFRQEPGPGYDGPITREKKRIEALKATPEYQARAAEYAKQKTAREALRNRDNPAATKEEADRRIAADAQAAARAAKHQAFKDATGGMNYRQYDRMTGSSNGNNSLTMKAVREGRLSPAEAEFRMQLRAEKALRRSGNPVAPGTSQAGTLYPDLMGRRGARSDQNPMTRFGMGTSNTPAGKLEAAGNVSKMTTEDPNIAALGIAPDAGLVGLHSAIAKQFEDDPNLEMDDATLRSYQMFAQQAMTADPKQGDPAGFTSGMGSVFTETEGAVNAELWKELTTLPDDKKARQQWIQKYKDRQKEIERRQSEYYGSYGSYYN